MRYNKMHYHLNLHLNSNNKKWHLMKMKMISIFKMMILQQLMKLMVETRLIKFQIWQCKNHHQAKDQLANISLNYQNRINRLLIVNLDHKVVNLAINKYNNIINIKNKYTLVNKLMMKIHQRQQQKEFQGHPNKIIIKHSKNLHLTLIPNILTV